MTDSTSDRHIESALNNIQKMSDYIQTGKTEVLEVGIDLLENKVENPEIDSLQDCIIELVKAEQRVKAFTQSVNNIKTRWQNDELDDSDDVVQILENDLKAEEEKSLEDRNVWDHELMVTFIEQMKAVDPGVVLKTGSSPSDAESNEAEDEIGVTGAQISLKCPITQCEMVEPVLDKVCNHSYEKDAVTAHIKQNLKRKRTPKCPHAGCTNVLQLANLQENTALKRILTRKKRGATTTQST